MPTIKNILRFPASLALLIALSACPAAVKADDGLSVTVTPPLIQLSIGPGESWTSTIKIVNNNSYGVTYYSQLMDMRADGEDGRSKFIPLIDEDQSDPSYQSFALARWITISPDPIVIPAGGSANVPFTVSIPSNAEPGGHYAAILIGTQPGAVSGRGSVTTVSSYVSSLIFVQIKGDAVESGRIREFSTGQSLYQSPNVDFTVRFENTGNTHLHPQGDVTIYNMWGKERGQILINNQDQTFGNVLPQSIRRFQFSWTGEQNVFDIGPYRAVVALDFGSNGKQNVSATTYFWIVPLVPVSIALGAILLFILLITWLIRRYIRRALMLEKMRAGYMQPIPAPQAPPTHTPVFETLIEPIREGVVDLRALRSGKPVEQKMAAFAVQTARQVPAKDRREPLSIGQFIKKYKLFFVFILVCVIVGVSIWWYFAKVLTAKRGYQITNVTIQSEPASVQ